MQPMYDVSDTMRADVENSTNTYNSLEVVNSDIVSKSERVKNSISVFGSQDVSDSRDVVNSVGVIHSTQIFGSKFIRDSYRVLDSLSVRQSENIVNSSSIIACKNIAQSHDIVDSSEICNCDTITSSSCCYGSSNLTNCLFCYNLHDVEFYVFNKPVDRRRYEVIKDEYTQMMKYHLLFVKDWPANLLVGASPTSLNTLNNYYNPIPQIFWDWVFTLPGYDAEILYSIAMKPTFLKNN